MTSLTMPVVSSVELFDWWRHDDYAAIRRAFGATSVGEAAAAAPGEAAAPRRRSWGFGKR